METAATSKEDWNDFEITHFTVGQGSLDEYIDKVTGKVVKVVMRGKDGEMTTMDCDPKTGRLNELKSFDKEGNIIKFQDQRALRDAVQTDGLWHARLLTEMQIQGGNAENAAAMIDQMLDEEMHAGETTKEAQ